MGLTRKCCLLALLAAAAGAVVVFVVLVLVLVPLSVSTAARTVALVSCCCWYCSTSAIRVGVLFSCVLLCLWSITDCRFSFFQYFPEISVCGGIFLRKIPKVPVNTENKSEKPSWLRPSQNQKKVSRGSWKTKTGAYDVHPSLGFPTVGCLSVGVLL